MARNKVRQDEVLGELSHVTADLWERPIDLSFLRKVRSVRLSDRIDAEDGVEPREVKAYRDFVERTDNYMGKAENAILKYYRSVCGGHRGDMGMDAVDVAKLPLIRSVDELSKLVTLEGVILNYGRDEPTCGLLCECAWEEEYGLGVLFKREGSRKSVFRTWFSDNRSREMRGLSGIDLRRPPFSCGSAPA
jgi:hypothetical protein